MEPKGNLLNVEMFPYTLSVTNAVATVTAGKDTLSTALTYNMSASTLYESGTYEHKLVLELIDPLGQSMEKTLTLGTDLQLGNFKSYTTTFTSSLYKTLGGGAIRLNLYDEFQSIEICWEHKPMSSLIRGHQRLRTATLLLAQIQTPAIHPAINMMS